MDDKKRILFVLPSLAGGGAERVFITLLKHFDRSRFSLKLALVHHHGPLLSQTPPDVEVIDLKARRVRYAIGPIIRTVRALQPDAVFSSQAHLNNIMLLCKPFFPKKTRLVARETNIPSYKLRNERYPWVFRFLYRRLYPYLDKLVCQCEEMRHDLVNGHDFPHELSVVINNPVDIDGVRALAKTKPEHVSPLYTPGVRNILAMGRLEKVKGYDLLLQAFAKADISDCELTFLGAGSQEDALKQLAGRLGVAERVRFLGFQQNPHPYLAQADIFALSSHFEGFPNVVLEAHACGVPVVAFSCPGGLDEIIRPGVNGWLAPTGDVDALAKLLSDHTAGASIDKDAVVESARSRYAVGKITRQYEALFLDS